jgi:hypothetical protein
MSKVANTVLGADEGLPAAWKKEDLAGMVVYGVMSSPPSTKIRCILQYHQVPFKVVGGKKPNDPYKYMPVVTHGGYQINDSFLIVKHLQPVLYGRPFTAEELAFDDMVVY